MTKLEPKTPFRNKSRDPGPEALRTMNAKGMTRSQIATYLGVTMDSVSHYFQKHGIRTDYRADNYPSRTKLREAVKASPTREAAANSLGISLSLFDKLCASHGIKGAGNNGRNSSRKHMTQLMRGSIAEAQTKAGHTKLVGTDTRALIDAAIAAIAAAGGQVPRCPTAFAAVSEHARPLSKEDSEALKAHQDKLDAA